MHIISLGQFNQLVETIRTETPLGHDSERHALVARLAKDEGLSLRTVQGVCSTWLGQANQDREKQMTREERQQLVQDYEALEGVCFVANHGDNSL